MRRHLISAVLAAAALLVALPQPATATATKVAEGSLLVGGWANFARMPEHLAFTAQGCAASANHTDAVDEALIRIKEYSGSRMRLTVTSWDSGGASGHVSLAQVQSCEATSVSSPDRKGEATTASPYRFIASGTYVVLRIGGPDRTDRGAHYRLDKCTLAPPGC
ncbi:MAG: hypothetical protein WDA27_08820 [Actinomycetota bacterium]